MRVDGDDESACRRPSSARELGRVPGGWHDGPGVWRRRDRTDVGGATKVERGAQRNACAWLEHASPRWILTAGRSSSALAECIRLSTEREKCVRNPRKAEIRYPRGSACHRGSMKVKANGGRPLKITCANNHPVLSRHLPALSPTRTVTCYRPYVNIN